MHRGALYVANVSQGHSQGQNQSILKCQWGERERNQITDNIILMLQTHVQILRIQNYTILRPLSF